MIKSIYLTPPLRARGSSHTFLSLEAGWSFELADSGHIVVRHRASADVEWLVPMTGATIERTREPAAEPAKPKGYSGAVKR